MAFDKLSSRAVIGMFYELLQAQNALTWMDLISNYFTSDQPSETYPWIGQSPRMREWIGGRQPQGFHDQEIVVVNKKFESSIDIPIDWFDDDHTGQIEVRIRELVEAATLHFWELLAAKIVTGETALCYDGQAFWSASHAEGDSGTQSNLVTYDISDGPASLMGSAATPSAEDFAGAFLKGIEAIIALKDDRGNFCNELLSEFIAFVPTTYLRAAAEAVGAQVVGNGRTNPMTAVGQVEGYGFKVRATPRLNATWTTKFPLFATDGAQKALIRQERSKPKLDVLLEGSDYAVKNDAYFYGMKARRNVAFGDWKKSVLVTLQA